VHPRKRQISITTVGDRAPGKPTELAHFSRLLFTVTCVLFTVTCGLVLSLAIAGSAVSQQWANTGDHRPNSSRPDHRLRRGVNLSHWFAQSQHGYGESHLSSFIVDRDIELVRQAGFTHMRLPISMQQSFVSGPVRDAYVARLAENVAKIHNAGLAVVVDLHPGQDDKQALIDSGDESYFVEAWQRLARAFAHANHELVIFELMNEPTPMVGPRWRALQKRTIEAIRTVAPRNTLIANPGGWSGVDDYAEFKPYSDANVVYTAHIYEPLLFTHQGATWVWDIASQVKDVWWPLAPESEKKQATRSGITDDAIRQLRYQISDGQFQVRWLLDRLDRLVQWQRRNGDPQIYIGEFGVYRAVAPEAASLRWHREVRQAFEARGWGWAVWDYAGGFGIARGFGKNKTLDAPKLRALGMLKTDTTERSP
jgi:aryl-phospho-beta-D-glucosidase BglC (GH1 family)